MTAATKTKVKIAPEPEPSPDVVVADDVVVPAPEPDPVFTYETKDGGTITLPLEWDRPDFTKPDDREWLWDLDAKPVHQQLWMWLTRAKIPRVDQRPIIRLELVEQVALFDAWFKASMAVTSGE